MPTAVSPLATSLALTDRFLESFDFREDVDKESIDLSGAHSWDITAVHARDKVVVDCRRQVIEAISIYLEEQYIDLLALGAYGRNPIRKLVPGGISPPR